MIEAIHRDLGLALLENGSLVPVVYLFDDEGELTDDFGDAVAFSAGDDSVGYFVYQVSDFQPARLQ